MTVRIIPVLLLKKHQHKALADVYAQLLHRAVTHVEDSFKSKDVDFCWQVAHTGYFLA